MSVTTAANNIEAEARPEAPSEPPAEVLQGPPPEAVPDAPAAVSRGDHGWVVQVTALSIVLGVMLALAIRTTSQLRSAGFPGSRFGVSAALLTSYRDQVERQRKSIEDLNEKLRSYQNAQASDSRTVELLKKELDDVKALAGLVAVSGPGVKITLRDSPGPQLPDTPAEEYLVHDTDINGVLNELKAAGARALAISGADPDNLQRIIVTTAARCVGPTAVVNDARLAAPYRILALGNPKELRAALEMPDGYVQSRGLDVLKMIEIQEAEHLVLPAYSGSISSKYARPETAANP